MESVRSDWLDISFELKSFRKRGVHSGLRRTLALRNLGLHVLTIIALRNVKIVRFRLAFQSSSAHNTEEFVDEASLRMLGIPVVAFFGVLLRSNLGWFQVVFCHFVLRRRF